MHSQKQQPYGQPIWQHDRHRTHRTDQPDPCQFFEADCCPCCSSTRLCQQTRNINAFHCAKTPRRWSASVRDPVCACDSIRAVAHLSASHARVIASAPAGSKLSSANLRPRRPAATSSWFKLPDSLCSFWSLPKPVASPFAFPSASWAASDMRLLVALACKVQHVCLDQTRVLNQRSSLKLTCWKPCTITPTKMFLKTNAPSQTQETMNVVTTTFCAATARRKKLQNRLTAAQRQTEQLCTLKL